MSKNAESLIELLGPGVHGWFFQDLVLKTKNFSNVTWLGRPVWQNVFDLWVMQETIAQIKPALLIETGTNRGGSALFFAHLFDLMGQGHVVTVDGRRMHDISHPRITFLVGNSIAAEIVEQIRSMAKAANGPVMVTLDSDHSEPHVSAELAAYAPLVTPGSYCLVQDGIIDAHPFFAADRPGPLRAIIKFLETNPDFTVDEEKSRKFLISHHPRGWLRRK